MDLQEIKNLWRNHQTQQSLQINRSLLRTVSLDRIRSQLGMFKTNAIIELIINSLGIVWITGIVFDQWLQWQYVIPAAILWTFIFAHLLWNIYSLTQLQTLSYGMTITEIQKRIGSLQLYQCYQIRALYVVIPVFAICFTVVILKAFLGIDIYQLFNVFWLYQILGSIVITPIIVWMLLKFPDKGLINAQDFLREIAEFEQAG